MAVKQKFRGLVALARGDDEKRYRLAEWLARKVHDDAILSASKRNWLRDLEFRVRYDRLKAGRSDRTMDRVYFLGQLARHAARIDGMTAECGSYSGMTSFEICHHTQPGKRHHVFDSFKGLSEPGEQDGTDWAAGDLSMEAERVAAVLSDFDVDIHEGWIPDRFDDVADERFALVHVDVDLYEPTRDSLAFFYERTAPGGVLVFDDYGSGRCPGATRAIDEFMADKAEIVVDVPTGQGFVVKASAP